MIFVQRNTVKHFILAILILQVMVKLAERSSDPTTTDQGKVVSRSVRAEL